MTEKLENEQEAHKTTGATPAMEPAEKRNSLVAFLRAIRFTRKSEDSSREGPAEHFAGLTSMHRRPGIDEGDCIRSAN